MALNLEDPTEADQDAVERFQAGDSSAFDELYARHRGRLYRYCRYRLASHEEAEDAVQETYVRAWANLASFGGDRHVCPWLRVIAGNICTDILRRRGRSRGGPARPLHRSAHRLSRTGVKRCPTPGGRGDGHPFSPFV